MHLEAPGAQRAAGWIGLGVGSLAMVIAVVAAIASGGPGFLFGVLALFALGTGVTSLRVRFDADASGLFIRNHLRSHQIAWRDVSVFDIARDFDRWVGTGTVLVVGTVMDRRIEVVASYLEGRASAPEQQIRARSLYAMREEFAPYDG